MGISLESMAIEMPVVSGHPNRVAFRGVLTTVDAASDRAPAGARGHRVLLTRTAAEEAIPSLLGMGLDYSPRLDGHDTRRKIGVITRAEIMGRVIEVCGFLYGRDFPEMVEEIGRVGAGSGIKSGRTQARVIAAISRCTKTRMPSYHRIWPLRGPDVDTVSPVDGGLGMSYEIADALVEDIKAQVWVLKRVTFTGAAVLRRDKAAYKSTWIELQ